jgi:hypothetical protein
MNHSARVLFPVNKLHNLEYRPSFRLLLRHPQMSYKRSACRETPDTVRQKGYLRRLNLHQEDLQVLPIIPNWLGRLTS